MHHLHCPSLHTYIPFHFQKRDFMSVSPICLICGHFFMFAAMKIVKPLKVIAWSAVAITFTGLTIFIGANIKKGPQIKLILLIYTDF